MSHPTSIKNKKDGMSLSCDSNAPSRFAPPARVKEVLRDYRCKKCGRHLFKSAGEMQVIKIKCKKCGHYNIFTAATKA
jgi:phage FluMu protein Com